MKMWVGADAAEATRIAAGLASETLRRAARLNPVTFAVSGGSTAPPFFAALAADRSIPWAEVHVLQVDERVAPPGHGDRNLTAIVEQFGSRLTAGTLHPMPVEGPHPTASFDTEDEPDDGELQAATVAYSGRLRQLSGSPPQLDLIHLGMGDDGHTASLLPHDSALGVERDDVAVSRRYDGRRRLTLTIPVLRNAHRQLWLITGESKADMAPRLMAGDTDIPAGRVITDRADVVLDQAAASEL